MADFAPAHPGEVLREEFLKPLDLSQYALAKAIGFRKFALMRLSTASAQSRPTPL
jgi:addiction module HigA family antidote